ncbi:hypothetical protein [Duganella sp. P38]|uniref:hypothetical protein n=1 Tax=Duganella sp. P38 TaxID=3423949 RepID=UPI003D79B11F
MNKPHLTGKKPNNGGLYNKMPNPQADFLPIKINDLGNSASRAMAARARLEKNFLCISGKADTVVAPYRESFDKSAGEE